MKAEQAVETRPSFRQYGTSALVGAATALLMAVVAIYEAPEGTRAAFAVGVAAFGGIAGVVLFVLRAWMDRGRGWIVAAMVVAGTIAGVCVGTVAAIVTGEGLAVVSMAAGTGGVILAGLAFETWALSPQNDRGIGLRLALLAVLVVIVAVVLVALPRTT